MIISEQLRYWELDGLFKIHLRHYLYITADFDVNEKLPNGDIESARFHNLNV
ncbi:CsiV family protein [Pseudoalteromonas sp. Hal099]